MNYQLIYTRFIEDRRQLRPARYDTHHIVPRCIGGTDDPSNLIRLSRSDHFFAHLLLARIHGGKLATAVFLMGNACVKAKVKISRRNFEWIRNAHVGLMRDQQTVRMRDPDLRRKTAEVLRGRVISQASIDKARETKRSNPTQIYTPKWRAAAAARMRGRKASAATKQKMSASQRGKKMSEASRIKICNSIKMDWERPERREAAAGWTMSAEAREKIARAKRGIARSEETRQKLSIAAKGKPVTADARLKISLALQGREKSAQTRARLSAAAKADWTRRRAARVAEAL